MLWLKRSPLRLNFIAISRFKVTEWLIWKVAHYTLHWKSVRSIILHVHSFDRLVTGISILHCCHSSFYPSAPPWEIRDRLWITPQALCRSLTALLIQKEGTEMLRQWLTNWDLVWEPNHLQVVQMDIGKWDLQICIVKLGYYTKKHG